jgi:Ca2+-transporting ATPase
MKNKPVKQKDGLFSDGGGLEIIFGGVIIGILSLSAYIIGANMGGHYVGRTMAFAALSLSQLFHSFNMTEGGIFSNLFLLGAFFVCSALQLSVIVIPNLREVFKTVALNASHWWVVGILSCSALLIGKIFKWLKK